MDDEFGASNNERLMAACREDSLELLEEVLESDPSTFNVNFTDGLGNSPLHNAARYASTQCLEVLLYFEGINVNIANRLEGDTPLHKAVVYEDPDEALEMARVLVEHGANLNAKNKLRQRPVDKAPSDTHGEVIEFLRRAELESQVDTRDLVVDDDDDSDGVPSDED
ncbi:hypothetical protein BGZ76_003196 [Entomortierella beljakovae]|nr:hypothetical protein BGZ76_003196 [Entomortierella beljakovae]